MHSPTTEPSRALSRRIRAVLPCWVAAALTCASSHTVRADDSASLPTPLDRQVDYARDVEPLLRKRCGRCHGPRQAKGKLRVDLRDNLLRGGDSRRPAVLPGNSAESRLIQLVSGLDEELVMPPKGRRLSASEIGTLRAWIDQGAVMAPTEASQETTEQVESAPPHWSFLPPQRGLPPPQPRLPPIQPRLPPLRARERDEDFVTPAARNAIDAFLDKKLEAEGLSRSPTIDRRQLIRRLYFVLHGLPPSRAEVDTFLGDQRPDAYERLVDRALASVRYGERWARYWLDLVRFGETHGFETNRERPDAWRFRDYVIDSLNFDKPYDTFVREQLAGDALGADVATGFLVAGPYDLVKSPDVNLTLMQRQDELADIVNTAGTAFLGLTIGCARCHDHKFDAITQTDYYSVQAVFAGVQHGTRKLSTADSEDELREVDARIRQLKRRLLPFVAASNEPLLLIDDSRQSDGSSPGLVPTTTPKSEKYASGRGRGERGDPGAVDRTRNVGGEGYSWWTNTPGKDLAHYQLSARGTYRIWIAWGSGWNTHSRDVRYVLDRDGDSESQGDQAVIATIDQQRFADKSATVPNRSLWSGFHNAGVHNLEPTTILLVRGGLTGAAVTADSVALERIEPGVEETDPSPRAGEATRPFFREPVKATHNVEHLTRPTAARYVRFTIHATNASEPCLDELEVFSGERNVALAASGARATSSGDLKGYPIHQLRFVNDGQYGNGRSWISNERGKGWVQIEFPDVERIDRIEWSRDREGRFADRVATDYTVEVAVEPGRWTSVASSASRPTQSPPATQPPRYDLDSVTKKQAAEAKRWLDELERLKSRREELLVQPSIYAGTFQQPGPTHRLYRGDPMAPREEVTPDAIDALGKLSLPNDTPEQERRLRFARWVTEKENPLTARVAVNRLWQFHFGTGIVDTPSDFGANGTAPSHPALLDWLALELVGSGWSLKRLHLSILTSAAFQQSNRPHRNALAIDAAGRLLWRFPPRRLEAEAIRDHLTSVAGTIDLRMGGPGFSAFEVQLENVRHYFPKKDYGPDDWRRMIYMTKVRQEQDAVFGAFDCPDASQVMPKRSRSTTPLQALNLFNSRFVLQQAEHFASRLERGAKSSRSDQVARAYALAFGRHPTKEEAREAVEFVEEHGLVAFCRALFNANEFVFLP